MFVWEDELAPTVGGSQDGTTTAGAMAIGSVEFQILGSRKTGGTVSGDGGDGGDGDDFRDISKSEQFHVLVSVPPMDLAMASLVHQILETQVDGGECVPECTL